MFPNNIEFFGHEKDQERFQDMDQIRLVRLAKMHRPGVWATLRNINHWLGRRMVQWGLRLQGYKFNVIRQIEETMQANSL
jgi:hypothetical protein